MGQMTAVEQKKINYDYRTIDDAVCASAFYCLIVHTHTQFPLHALIACAAE